MNPEKRVKLIEWLLQDRDRNDVDKEEWHSTAEALLLDAIGDAELSGAWAEAAQHWWYA
jgi:hypothetical protein